MVILIYGDNIGSYYLYRVNNSSYILWTLYITLWNVHKSTVLSVYICIHLYTSVYICTLCIHLKTLKLLRATSYSFKTQGIHLDTSSTLLRWWIFVPAAFITMRVVNNFRSSLLIVVSGLRKMKNEKWLMINYWALYMQQIFLRK